MINKIKKLFSNQSQTGICDICQLKFPDKELNVDGKLAFCPKHYTLFKDNTWEILNSYSSSPLNPAEALKAQDIKNYLWEKEIPTYILSDYAQEDNNIITSFHIYTTSTNSKKAKELLLSLNS